MASVQGREGKVVTLILYSIKIKSQFHFLRKWLQTYGV
jgi:hypothetical protein